MACKEQLKLVQHCEKEFANHDESFENDFENINSGAEDAYEEFADESLADESFADESLADDSNGIGNIVIKDELSESASQTAILKNPIDVKKIQNKGRKTTLDLLPPKRKCKSEIKKLI